MRVLRWWSVISFWLLSLLGQFSWWTSYIQLELERVPNPARRPGPEEKLAINKPKTHYYLGQNLGQPRELFDKLDKVRETVG